MRNQLAFESDTATNCTDRPSFFSSVHNDPAIPAREVAPAFVEDDANALRLAIARPSH